MRLRYRRPAARTSAALLSLASLALANIAIATVGAAAPTLETDGDIAAPSPWIPPIDMRDGSSTPSARWETADGMPVWRTISLGTYANVNVLREALASETCRADGLKVAGPAGPVRTTASDASGAPHCRLGDSAGEIIGRPAFRLSRLRQDLDLVVVSAAELGFNADENVALEAVDDRAELLGFALCPADIGPLLRLDYVDQPEGEFLHVAMVPIATYAGQPTDFTLGNDGAALLLLGGDGRPDLTVSAVTRFVFVRPRPRS